MSGCDLTLTKQDTSVLKGIAIAAMLMHHMYYSKPDWIESYDGVLEWLGILGKVCVAIFLFCSGYGLSVQYRKVEGIKNASKYILRRFVSFYANYWVIFLVFVPITVFLFNRPLSDAYHGIHNTFICLCQDLLGLAGSHSYNATWWFNKLIIILYILFPLFYWCAKKSGMITLLISLAIWRYAYNVLHWEPFGGLDIYQLPFVMGILWKKWESENILHLNHIKTHFFSNSILLGFISILFLICTILLRMHFHSISFREGVSMDAFVTLGFVFVVLSVFRHSSLIINFFSFLGKHATNIYLIHTFIIGYWHLSWLHSGTIMRSGMNLIVVFVLCVGISILLEYLKEICGLNKLVQSIKTRLT